MVVYQGLRRLTGSAEVRAVLDGSEYDEGCHSNSDTESDTEANHPLTSKSYLTNSLTTTLFHDEYQEEETLDPASITQPVSHNDGTRQYEPVFPRKKVIWLNGSPRSYQELAVAFITVSLSLPPNKENILILTLLSMETRQTLMRITQPLSLFQAFLSMTSEVEGFHISEGSIHQDRNGEVLRKVSGLYIVTAA